MASSRRPAARYAWAKLPRTSSVSGWCGPRARSDPFSVVVYSLMASSSLPASWYALARLLHDVSVSGCRAPRTRARSVRVCSHSGIAWPRSSASR